MIAADRRMIKGGMCLRPQKRLSHYAVLAVLVVLSILMALIATILNDIDSFDGVDLGVMFTFAINAILGFTFLVRSILDKPFSLAQIHWLFYVTMFVVAPASQYLYGYSPWGYAISSYDYQVANALLLIWGGLFALITSLNPHIERAAFSSSSNLFRVIPEISFRASVSVFVLAIIATMAVVNLVGIENLFSRGMYSTGLDKTAGLLFDKVIRPLPVFAFALLYVHYRQSRSGIVLLICAGLLMLVADFPTAMARYSAACLYGGLTVLMVDPLRMKRGVFPALLLVAFLVIFPASNVYRWSAFELSAFFESVSNAYGNLSRGFCAVDYDAYSMIPRALHFIEANGTTQGFQLLSVFLFFIPRAIWPIKSNGSGYLIAASQGQIQLNVSCPLPSEGIINYGIIGFIVLAVVIAIICREIDGFYQSGKGKGLCVFYPFACMMLFYIMRGDLLSSFAFLCGYLVSFSILWVLVRALSPKQVCTIGRDEL